MASNRGKGIIFGKISIYSEDTADRLEDMQKVLNSILTTVGYPESSQMETVEENEVEAEEPMTVEDLEELEEVGEKPKVPWEKRR
jgi:hypothetical protein